MFQFQNPKIPEFLPTNELVFQAYSIPICENNHPFETQLAKGLQNIYLIFDEYTLKFPITETLETICRHVEMWTCLR